MKRISNLFFWDYGLRSWRKKRIQNSLITVICAGAVAFTAMSMGFLKNFLALQNEYMNNISERELIVYNNVSVDNVYSLENPPISSDTAKQILTLRGAEKVAPLILFYSLPIGFTLLSVPDELSESEYKEEQNKQIVSTIKATNAVGMKKAKDFKVDTGDNYLIVSYPDAEMMDNKALYIDRNTIEGGYITERFMKRLDLSLSDIKELTLAIECWINPLQKEDIVKVYDQINDETITESLETRYFPWTQKKIVTVKIRGVIPDTELPQEGDIFLSADQMLSEIKECPLESDKLERFIRKVNEMNPEKEIPDFFEWSPNAYYIIADSVKNIEPLKLELQKLDPNFKVVHFYQDFNAGIQLINNNRSVLLYISYSVLAVVLLLTALIYASLIDKRKFEFAVLRANGLTKKEVRKVIYSEMLLEFVRIFLTGIAFSGLIYLVADVWLGYPFCYDWMTILWLTIISLGAIILPTVISLFFVNKFEPDEVMRNEVR